MEYLRWILLAAGIFFILFVYLLGRNRRRQNQYEEFESQHDVPEFSAHDWDDLDEGVGEVRIIARDTSDEYHDEPAYDAEPDVETETFADSTLDEATVTGLDSAADSEYGQQRQRNKASADEIIVLMIIAHPEQKFSGDKINSAAKASGLVFGEMNIYHRLDDDDQPVFGLANMIEPGSFDPATMHDMRTPGLTLFMQPAEVVEPEAALDDMLQCAYRMAEMLGGQLCNRRRQALTQNDTERYRELVAGIDA